MSEKLTPFDEFMEALPCCDTVKVILTGCGESVFETKPIYEGICKLANRRAERTGRWIEDDTVYCGAGKRWYKCASCNELVFTAVKGSKGYRFCPNCGARMDGERRNDDA